MQQKIRQIYNQLTSLFLEREEVIDVSLACMVAGEHILFLGPPGTAKSQLARAISDSIGGASYFEWLLTRFTTPEEIYGPVSLSALQKDRFERITTGKLPDAHIAFLDEVFKASSAILNSLLAIINERIYHNNGTAVRVPLLSLIGASNELPQAEDLTALFDRFLVKFWVGYVNDASFRNLLTLPDRGFNPAIGLDELKTAQKQAAGVAVTDATLDAIEKLRAALQDHGIQMSDRKWRQGVKLVKAAAWINKKRETSPEELDIIKHVAWSDPNDRSKVARIVASVSNPLGAALLDIEDSAREIFDNAMKAGTADAGAEANQKLKSLQKDLDKLLAKNKAHAQRIDALKAKVQAWNHRIIKEILGLDL